MVTMRLEDHPSFEIVGRKTWISGQDNEQFGVFWEASKQNGLIESLRKRRNDQPGTITKSYVFGVSCVEENPDNRAFNFFIAAEMNENDTLDGFERHQIPSCTWAIFSNSGDLPMSLIDAEMYAFKQWLPSSPYRHANAPELEVYPACDDKLVEFWLPVIVS